MSWRYQVVYKQHDEETYVYSICEVYLDKDEKLVGWTENKDMTPCGESSDELLKDLQMMIRDTKNWEAVPIDSLAVGMIFNRTINLDQ